MGNYEKGLLATIITAIPFAILLDQTGYANPVTGLVFGSVSQIFWAWIFDKLEKKA